MSIVNIYMKQEPVCSSANSSMSLKYL